MMKPDPSDHLLHSVDETLLPHKSLFRIAGIAAMIVILLIPIQLIIFSAWPPPEDAAGFFELFRTNAWLGLLSPDLIYLLNNAILILFYLGLYKALEKTDPSLMLIAIVAGLVGIATYYSSSVAFEMLNLSKLYHSAGSGEVRQQCLASGQTLLAVYKGSAFDAYYVLNAAALLIMSWIMLKGSVFSRATGYWGLASGILMLIPSTAGTLGLIFSIASLIPWIGFSILAGRRLIKMG